MITQSDLIFYFMRTFDILMIFTPNLGFIAQIIKFRNLKSSQGFSKLLSFITLIANILRIYFWVGKRFSIYLLLQSVCSVVMQIVLINECLKWSEDPIKKENYKSNAFHFNLKKPISLLDYRNFWDWPYLIDYIYFLTLFSIIIGLVSNIIGFEHVFYVESLGAISATVEAVVGVPQMIINCKTKNTDSLSYFMIASWLLGDFIKTIYFFKTNSPLQLILCGLFQITIDSIIVIQMLCYYKSTEHREYKEYKSVKLQDSQMIINRGESENREDELNIMGR
jgi:uncharacterized protein with PQ loop repeat